MGASEKTDRYSNKAIRDLRKHGHPVIAVGLRKGQVLDVPIEKEYPSNVTVNTVTLYLNPSNQRPHYDFIVGLKPQRIIFNPGTENPELADLAEDAGIETIEACTLVMLSTGQF